jgi:hyaluronan synthase
MLQDLAGYVPLGVLGLIRWLSWIVRRMPASLYRPVVNDHSEPLSIVVPVYQEDPDTLRHALASWIANDIDEIICVVDVTDEQSMQICRAAGVTVLPTAVPGKRDALRRGWEHASTPLVALVDSDTIWAHDVAAQVCMPFADPAVGAVGTRQNVSRPATVWEHINDLYLDYRYFDEIASQTVAGRAVSVVSGRTAVYRRHLLLDASERFMGERFMGRTILSGDDKRLTTLVLEGGHLTVLQRSARVWSDFPSGARQFFVQRLRWSRNTWRSDLRALGSRWVWRHPFLAFSMVDKAISPFTLLISPCFLVLALVRGDMGVAVALVVWWVVSRSAKALPHLDRKPQHMLTLMPVFIPITFVMALVKIWALCTIRTSGWMTRDVAVGDDGEFTRTGDGLDAEADHVVIDITDRARERRKVS